MAASRAVTAGSRPPSAHRAAVVACIPVVWIIDEPVEKRPRFVGRPLLHRVAPCIIPAPAGRSPEPAAKLMPASEGPQYGAEDEVAGQ